MTDFRPISYDEALATILGATKPLAGERVELAESLGRALAVDITAGLDLPGFDNSAMDGYALRSVDTTAAEAERPITLHVVGRVSAGASELPTIEAWEAVSIGTGAPIPPGADAVLRLEEVMRSLDIIEVYGPVPSGRDIRRAGEDIARGSRVLSPGQDLGAAQISLLAALGHTSIDVVRRPRVALLTTGDELVSPGQDLAPGQIYNANAAALLAQVTEAGGIPVPLQVSDDDPAATERGVQAGLECDVLVVSAGVSVGERDFVRPALSRFGEVQSWRLEMRPVRPLAFGQIGSTLVLGLPGNPTASFLAFELLVRPALRALGGHAQTARPQLTAKLAEPIDNPGGLLTFVRGVLTFAPEPTVRSAGGQSTSNLATLAAANCMIEAPTGRAALEADSSVRVRLLAGNA